MKIKYIIIFSLIFSTRIWGQSSSVHGIVLDETSREPVVGATIKVEGTQNITSTDFYGRFHIQALPDAILKIVHLSYETKEISASKAGKIFLKSRNVSLDEIVVKANPLKDITHSVVVMDNIKKGSQPRNAADLFKDIPGFNIQKRSSMAMEPSLRAFKYEEMNIKYDGGSKMVNACPNRMDPITAHVIPEEVRRIEVIKGPYTVRFGQTFGGIVNMVTRPPTPDQFGLQGNIQAGYETNGNNIVNGAELMYAQKKFDITLNGEYRNFGDYFDGDNLKTPAGFKTTSYGIKFGYNPKENQRLQMNWHQKFGKNIKHAGLMMDSPKDDSYLLTADYKIKKLTDKIKSISFKSYYSFVDHLMTNGYGMEETRPNYPGIDARTPVTSNTLGGKFELGLTPNEELLVYTGLDADIIKRNGTKTVIVNNNPNTGVPLDPPSIKKLKVWQDAGIYDFGIFAEANYKAADAIFLTFGIRSDYVNAEIPDPATGFENIYGKLENKTDITIGGNLSVKYKKDALQMQLAYGRGTRTPSMIERYIYRFIVGTDSREYIGNPRLKPEINNQFEYSIQKKWDGIHTGSSIFYSYLQDYITPIINAALTSNSGGCGGGTPKPPKQFKNVNAYQYGFDAFLYIKLNNNLRFTSDVSFTKAYNTTLDEPLSQVAPMSAHFGLKYEKTKYWIDFRSELVATQKDFAPSFNETETSGHTAFDLRLGWKPFKGFSIGGAILNIANKTYYNHLNFAFKNADENNGRRIYEQGRNFSFYAKYKF